MANMEVLKTIREVVAENLRKLRGNRSQTAMAELCGLPMRTYANFEYAKSLPSEETLAILTKNLGISESELFLDAEAAPEPSLQQAMGLFERSAGLLESVPLSREVIRACQGLNQTQIDDVIALILAYRKGITAGKSTDDPQELRRGSG